MTIQLNAASRLAHTVNTSADVNKAIKYLKAIGFDVDKEPSVLGDNSIEFTTSSITFTKAVSLVNAYSKRTGQLKKTVDKGTYMTWVYKDNPNKAITLNSIGNTTYIELSNEG